MEVNHPWQICIVHADYKVPVALRKQHWVMGHGKGFREDMVFDQRPQ